MFGSNIYAVVSAGSFNVIGQVYQIASVNLNAKPVQLINATAGHPFYLVKNVDGSPRKQPVGYPDLDKNWVSAGDLKIGDQVRQADGSIGTVTFTKTVQETKKMYNLSVAVAQTYYVGEGQWLVHNCGEFDIIPYSRSLADINRARKAQGLEPLEKHHGVLNEWAQVHLGSLGYTKGAAPTIALT